MVTLLMVMDVVALVRLSLANTGNICGAPAQLPSLIFLSKHNFFIFARQQETLKTLFVVNNVFLIWTFWNPCHLQAQGPGLVASTQVIV